MYEQLSFIPEVPLKPSPEVFIGLPMKNGRDFAITEKLVQELEPLYPAVDVPQTFREMKGWLIGNPTRRKTRRGMMRFVTQWLQNEQEKHGG